MIALLTTIHILAAIVLVLSVLLQSSKGSDVAGAFGGMGSQAAFGPRGTATFLSKTTVVVAAIFVVTSVTLVRLGSDTVGGGDSVLSDEPVATTPTTPATPAPVAGGPAASAAITSAPAPADGQAAPVVQSIKLTPPTTGAAGGAATGAAAPQAPNPAAPTNPTPR